MAMEITTARARQVEQQEEGKSFLVASVIAYHVVLCCVVLCYDFLPSFLSSFFLSFLFSFVDSKREINIKFPRNK